MKQLSDSIVVDGCDMENVISLLPEMDAVASQEIPTQFVSDLFYTQAKKCKKRNALLNRARVSLRCVPPPWPER